MPVPRFIALAAILLAGNLAAQSTLLVSDADGEPLVGATVIRLPDEGIGVTDAEGSIQLPSIVATDTFQVSYLGYRPIRVAGTRVQGQTYELKLAESYGGISLQSATVIGRRDESARHLPYQIETVDQVARAQVQSLTTVDALFSLSGVYVQKSQFGGGSPILRGFEANRVLLVVDGVRMNNAIFRSGHLQNAITVDPNALDRIEVIYGSGALAYGSDAIGGVVHFRTNRPEFRGPQASSLSGYQDVNLASAANSINVAGGLEYGGQSWAGITNYSIARFGDLRAGGNRPEEYGDFGLRNTYVCATCGPADEIVENEDPNVQVGSGYRQYNLLQKLRFRLADRLELSANAQFSTTSDIPRYDALTEVRNGNLRWARWDYGPQTRLLGSLRLDDRRATSLYDIATYLVSYQFVEEDRIQRRFMDDLTEESLVDVNAINFQLDYAKNLGAGTDLRYGLDLRREDVMSTVTPATESTRYPSGGSGLAGGGTYVELSRALGDFWQLRGGLRYAYQRLTATFGADDPIEWPADYLEGIVNNSSSLTGALGLHLVQEVHGARFLVAQGFRAPNIDDFAKFREQSGRVQVPNPDLQPERSTTFEAAYTYSGDLRLEATGYLTLLNDAIIRKNGVLPDGRASFVSRGDTLFVDTNVNAERAWVYGFDVTAAWSLGKYWEARSSFHWLRGRRRQAAPDERLLTLPQDHIPPAYGKAGLVYARGPLNTRLSVDFQFDKPESEYAVNTITGTEDSGYTFDRVGSADNIELTPNEAGLPGWWTLNLYANYELTEDLTLRLKGENLLDRHYRTFASGIASPGIDLGVGVTWRWGS